MADAKYERSIVLEDEALLKMVAEKGDYVEQGRTISRMMEEAQQQIDKLTTDMQALTSKVINHRLKIFKLLKKATRGMLSESEIPVTTEIRDGKLILVVSDAVAEFREQLASIDQFTQPVPISKKSAGR